MRERYLIYYVRYGVALCHIGLEELHTGGNVIEQVADDECGAVGTARVVERYLLAALYQIPCADILLTSLGDELEMRY